MAQLSEIVPALLLKTTFASSAVTALRSHPHARVVAALTPRCDFAGRAAGGVPLPGVLREPARGAGDAVPADRDARAEEGAGRPEEAGAPGRRGRAQRLVPARPRRGRAGVKRMNFLFPP